MTDDQVSESVGGAFQAALAILDIDTCRKLPVDQKALLLYLVEEFVNEVKMFRDALANAIYRDLTTQEKEALHIEGLPPLVVDRGGSYENVDGVRIASLLAARVADEPVDLETGEILPPSLIAAKVASELVECFSLNSPSVAKRVKSTALKARGLSKADFSTYAQGERANVKFVSPTAPALPESKQRGGEKALEVA